MISWQLSVFLLNYGSSVWWTLYYLTGMLFRNLSVSILINIKRSIFVLIEILIFFSWEYFDSIFKVNMKNIFDNSTYLLRIFHATLLYTQLKPMHIMKPIINKRFRFPSADLQILKLVVQFDDDRVLAVHFIIIQYRLVISKIYLFFMFVFENANKFILRQLNISFLILFFMFKSLLSFYFFFSLLTQFLSFMFR